MNSCYIINCAVRVDLTEKRRIENARTPMRRRVKAHNTPPKAFRRRPPPPPAAVEDRGSGIAAEKQSFFFMPRSRVLGRRKKGKAG
jgi:hypothetical protein